MHFLSSSILLFSLCIGSSVYAQYATRASTKSPSTKPPTHSSAGKAKSLPATTSIPSRSCPCSDAKLCNIRSTNNTARKEVYGFALSLDENVYNKYDWNKLTTLAMWNFTDALMCLAHKHNVKLHLVVSDNDLPHDQLTNITWRAEFVHEQVQKVKDGFLDGINFDPEYPIADGSPQRKALVDLINETKITLNRQVPGAMVVFDAAWATYCVDERCYDYHGIAEVADFLFIMAYCVQGQIWGPCIAQSNTPFFRMIQGVRGFFALGIPPSKLVLGLPWFGYDYPCDALSENNICDIPAATYHGAPCSDLVGEQRGIDELTNLVNNQTVTSITEQLWNPEGQSPQFNYINETGGQRQVHWDDAGSLLLKYIWAVSNDLRGVGFWHIGYLNDLAGASGVKLRKRYWDMVPSEDSWANFVQNSLQPNQTDTCSSSIATTIESE